MIKTNLTDEKTVYYFVDHVMKETNLVSFWRIVKKFWQNFWRKIDEGFVIKSYFPESLKKTSSTNFLISFREILRKFLVNFRQPSAG